MFPICCYLLDHGYQTTLFLLDEYEHFIPKAEFVPRKLEIVSLDWNEESFETVDKETISSLLSSYNFFIGTDYAAAYLAKAKIRMDIYMPAGSDLFAWPFKKFTHFPAQTWEINKVKCARSQLFGIRHANHISLDYTNLELERLLKKTGNKSKRIGALPSLYFKKGVLIQQIGKQNINSGEKQKREFIVMQHGRQAWKYTKDNLYNKGNDILLYGFAKFVNTLKDSSSVVLKLLDYGEHVHESKKLIKELKIDSHVEWIDKMHRDDLIVKVAEATVSVGSLNRSWFSYGAVYEALANKVAFMGFRKDELYIDHYPELYPMCNASTAEEVATGLKRLFQNRKEAQQLGIDGHAWLLKYAINPIVKEVIEIVKSAGVKRKLPMDWKLFLMKPYFLFVRGYNFFRIRLNKWVKI